MAASRLFSLVLATMAPRRSCTTRCAATISSVAGTALRTKDPGSQRFAASKASVSWPDWWNVVMLVTDYLATRPDVDMSHLALAGVSFGSSLTPRIAAHDHHFAALLLVDGLDSLLEALLQQLPSQMTKLFEAHSAIYFDQVTHYILSSGLGSTSLRWGVDQGKWSFNTASAYNWMDQLCNYNLGDYLANVTCPIFVGSGQDDTTAASQAAVVEKKLKALGGKNYEYVLFKTDLEAGEHCQIGAESQLAMASLDWLDRISIYNGTKALKLESSKTPSGFMLVVTGSIISIICSFCNGSSCCPKVASKAREQGQG